MEINTGVGWVGLPIPTIHTPVAEESKIQWLLAALHNPRWMDHRQVCDGCVKAIPVLDPMDVEKAYSDSASGYRCSEWYVQSYGRRYASFG